MNILFVVNEDLNLENLGIMSISSILKRAGHGVDIVEARYNKIKRKLRNNNSAILAYSIHSLTASYYLELNRRIKEEFNVFSVFGGPHPTHFPEIINEPGVDGVCIGEGDYALPELVNNLKENKPITNIANWWIKIGGQIFRNPSRPLIKDLDSLPFADRTLFPNSYTISIVTGRGCPYKCPFCMERGEFRRRSVDNVIEELREAKAKTNGRFIYFFDSTFNISLPWLKEFSEKYRKEIGLPFYCHARADLVTPECIKYLKDAGCFSVLIGVETANDYLRNEILKKRISKEQIIFAAEIIKRYKIRLGTFNMIGIPLGSWRDDLETLKLNIKLHPDYAKADALCLYKKTELYNALIQNQRFKHLEAFSNYKYAYLDFNNSVSNMRKIKNLYHLFSLVAGFPFLLPLVPFLIRLPLHRLYLFFSLCCRGYCRYFRIGGGYYLGLRSFFIVVKRYLKYQEQYSG